MKTQLITLFLSAIAFNAFSQTTPSLKKWSFGAELFPNSTFKIISNNGSADPAQEQFWNEIEVAKFCLSGQLYASYKINSKSSISFGAGYQNTGNQTKSKQLSFGNSIDSRRGFTYDSTSSSVATHVKYKYNITKKFYARAGISRIYNFSNTINQVLIDFNGKGTRSTEEDSRVATIPYSEYRNLNFSGNLGIGYSYYKTANLDLYIQANAETTFMQLWKIAPLNRRPVSIGFIFGARI